MRRGKL